MLSGVKNAILNQMASKMKIYQNLWQQHTKLSTENYETYYKKVIDTLCLKADMCESVDEYVITVCEGMQELIDMGVPKSAIMNHPIALAKILRLGEDVMEVSYKKSDIFYIGLFIDLRISMNWFKRKFYQLIKLLIEQVVHKAKEFPEKLKYKLQALAKKENYALYALYFLKNKAPPLKKVA